MVISNQTLIELNKHQIIRKRRHLLNNLKFLIINDEIKNESPEFITNDVIYFFARTLQIPQNIKFFENSNIIGISDKCFIDIDDLEYSIIHEIFYFIIYNNIGCISLHNIYNVNNKFQDLDIKFNIDGRVFIKVFNIINDIIINNRKKLEKDSYNLFTFWSSFSMFEIIDIRKIFENINIDTEVLNDIFHEYRNLEDIISSISANLYFQFKKKKIKKTSPKINLSSKNIYLGRKENKLEHIHFFIIDDKLRNVHPDFNIDDVKIFPKNEYHSISDKYVFEMIKTGNAIGVSDKYLNSPELKSMIIREIINFMVVYRIKLINPDIPYHINCKLQRKNILINIDYKTLVIEKMKIIK